MHEKPFFDPDFLPDAEKRVARHTAWWNNGCLGRPVVHLRFPREKPLGPDPTFPELGDDAVGRHVHAEFRLAVTEYTLNHARYFGDTIPSFSPGLNIAYTAALAEASVIYGNSDWRLPDHEPLAPPRNFIDCHRWLGYDYAILPTWGYRLSRGVRQRGLGLLAMAADRGGYALGRPLSIRTPRGLRGDRVRGRDHRETAAHLRDPTARRESGRQPPPTPATRNPAPSSTRRTRSG